MHAAAKTMESRRAPREPVSFRAPIRGAGGAAGRVLLVDLSPFGFMARGTLPLGVGEVVTLTLPVVGSRRAVLRWSLGGRVGGEFAEALSAHDYARVLAMAPHDRPSWDEM